MKELTPREGKSCNWSLASILFSRFFLSAYSVPGTVLGTGDSAENKMHEVLALLELTILEGGSRQLTNELVTK